MGKVVTSAGLKGLDDVVREVVDGARPCAPSQEPARIVVARRLGPGEPGLDAFDFEMARYEVEEVSAASAFRADPVTVPDGPAGFPALPPFPSGLNGRPGRPAAAGVNRIPTADSLGISFSPEPPRPEVELREALRRCLREDVPTDRIVEIFRTELVEAVHDE